jgi:hypothetical protein
VFKRDRTITRPFDEATWVAADGLRYTRPEIALAYKVRQDRAKDRVDLAAAWPLLEPRARDWLVSYVAKVDASHPWLDLLD